MKRGTGKKIGKIVLLAVPLFVFLGALIEMNADGRAVSIQRVQIPDHGG